MKITITSRDSANQFCCWFVAVDQARCWPLAWNQLAHCVLAIFGLLETLEAQTIQPWRGPKRQCPVISGKLNSGLIKTN